MPASPPRIYFDANVFLAYVSNEEGRASVVRTLLAEAGRGEIEIVTSVLSIAEVAFGAMERDQGLTEEGEKEIDELWTPASPVQPVDVTQALTRKARYLIRTAKTKRLSLQGADAVHLASAVMFDCVAVFTYEDGARRSRWNELTEIEVAEPYTNRPTLDV